VYYAAVIVADDAAITAAFNEIDPPAAAEGPGGSLFSFLPDPV